VVDENICRFANGLKLTRDIEVIDNDRYTDLHNKPLKILWELRKNC